MHGVPNNVASKCVCECVCLFTERLLAFFILYFISKPYESPVKPVHFKKKNCVK